MIYLTVGLGPAFFHAAGGQAPMYPAPVAAAALEPQHFSQHSGVRTFDASGAFTGSNLSFSLAGMLQGVTIDPSSGLVAVDTGATGLLEGASVVFRAANASGVAEAAAVVTVAAPSQPALLVIVAGQSNAIVDGTNEGNAPASYHAITSAHIWVGAQNAFVPLDVGVNSGPAGASHTWGDECAIAAGVNQAQPGREIYIVKHAENGASLASAANNSWDPSLGANQHFNSLRTAVNAARAALSAAGRTWEEITTWCQGEADTNTLAAAGSYFVNLTGFLQAYRAQVSTGEFLIERIRPYSGDLAVKTYENQFLVRKAQEAIAAADPSVGIISLDFSPSNFNALHPGAAWAAEKGARAYAWHAGSHDTTYGAVNDIAPDNLAFAGLSEAIASTVYVTDLLTPAIGQHAPVVITGGEYRVLNPDNSEAIGWTTAAGTIHPFQKVQLRLTSATASNTEVAASVSVGPVTAAWTVRTGASGPNHAPETLAFLATLASGGGTAMSPSRAAALDAFYVAAKAASWWPKLHRLYASLHDPVGSAIDLKDQITRATQIGVNASVTWTHGFGWSTGALTGRGLDLKLNPAAATAQNSVALGVWYTAGITNSVNSATPDITSDQSSFRLGQTHGGALTARLHGGNQTVTGVTTAPGLRVASRTGSTTTTFYGPQGTPIGSSAVASTGLVATATTLFVPPTGSGTTNGRSIGAVFVSAGLNDGEVASLNAALGALLAAFVP